MPDYKRRKKEEVIFATGEDTSYIQDCDNTGCVFYKDGKCQSFGTECFGYIEPDNKRKENDNNSL